MLTKDQRRQIAEDFATRHNGIYSPVAFRDEVQRTGPEHPAYDWFEWDTDRAADRWQVEQAREFVRGLTIRFEIEDIESSVTVKGESEKAFTLPGFISPVAGRAAGGGYLPTSTSPRGSMDELTRQAARDLRAWMRRYQTVIAQHSISTRSFDTALRKMDAVGAAEEGELV